jgi:hypothetical protein
MRTFSLRDFEKAMVIAAFMLLALCVAESEELPAAPVVQHSFFSTETILETAALTGESAYDGWATQKTLSSGLALSEGNPIARPLVMRGTPGQVASSAIGVGLALGASYTLHHFGHPRMAQWVMRVSVAGEGANCVRQYGQLHLGRY